MLSAILSDTLLFKSPTTTAIDIKVGHELARIADVDINEYGMKMFKAASTVSELSVYDIIHSDMKTFKYDDSTISISQVMTLDFDDIHERAEDVITELNHMCEYGNLKIALLFVTDVIRNGSYLFYSENCKDLIEDAYGVDEIYQGIYFDGVVSRKKQMLPPLLEIEDRR